MRVPLAVVAPVATGLRLSGTCMNGWRFATAVTVARMEGLRYPAPARTGTASDSVDALPEPR